MPLHDRDELHVARLDLVPQEPVHLQGMRHIRRVYGGQDVVLDPVSAK